VFHGNSINIFDFYCLIGPRGMPFLGFAPFFPTNKPFFSTLQKMAKKYGPVIGFYLGPTQPFISVDGKQAAKEALLNNDLNGRPSGTVIISRSFGEKRGNLIRTQCEIDP
jgi:hypothetical protein